MKKKLLLALLAFSIAFSVPQQEARAAAAAVGVTAIIFASIAVIAVFGKNGLRSELHESAPETAEYISSEGKTAAGPVLGAILRTAREEMMKSQGEEAAKQVSDLDLARAVLQLQQSE
jgi:hypothetical protein